MGKLRLGVIGAGSWVMASHLPNFARHADEVEFSIVNRRSPELLARAQREFGFLKASADWHDVIAERPDIVVVARTGRQIVIPFGWNHRPMVPRAKELMEEDGGIGEVEQMTITMASTTRELLSNTGAYPFASPDAAPRPETGWTRRSRAAATGRPS